MTLTSGAAVLVEREDDLASLMASLRAAASGQGSCVLVEGPAGIGKTSLLDAAIAAAENGATATSSLPAGSRLLLCRHRCTTGEAHQPFAAVIGLLAEAVFARPDDDFRGASALAVPLFRDGETGHRGEFPLLHGLHWLTVSLSEERPLVLVVDDVQWADPASVRFLRYLAERVAGHRILLLVGARTGEPAHPDLVDFLERPQARLTLEPLSGDGVRAVTDAVTGQSGPGVEALAAQVAGRSGGNPFFVHELLRHVTPGLTGVDATPSSVVEAVQRQLATLPPPAADVAVAVATLGEATSVGEVAALTCNDVRTTALAVDDLVAAALLDDVDPRRFRHPLLRDAVASSVPVGRRLDLAAASAELLATRHPVRAAEHLVGAPELAPLRETWVVPTLRDAARVSTVRGGGERAVAYLERALAEPLDPPAECDVRRMLGVLLDDANDVTALEHLARAWELAPTSPEASTPTVAAAYADALFHFALLEESGAVCRQAQESLGPDESERRLLLEATALNSEAMIGINRDRPARLQGQVETAATPGERAVLAHVAWDRSARGDLDHRAVADLARRAGGGGLLLDEVGPASPLFVYAGTALAWAGAYEEVAAYATAGVERAVAAGSLVGLAYATALRAGNAVYRGEIAQAETDAQRVLEELADADPMCFAMSVGWQLEICIERESPEVGRTLVETFGLDGELPDIGTIDTLLLSRARLWIEVGELDRALVDLAEVARRGRRSSYLNPIASPWRSMTAQVHLLQGRADDESLTLVDAELAHARAYGAPRAIGVALLARARLVTGRAAEQAVEHLREALDVLDGSGADLVLAEVMIDLGARTGAGTDAQRRRILRDAMDLAHRCGSWRAVSRAMEALRETGARPRRPRVKGLQALTPQERRVTQLAATGQANRDIAEALFLTRRTVELHLTNAYRKLGIDGRAELAAALAER
jgi:DNA-binding CsgD family transcriptional regulator